MSDFKKIPPPDWEGKPLIKRWRENANAVLPNVKKGEKGIMKRIATYCHNFGYDCKRVIAKIIDDEMFAAHFAINPSQQTIHEKLAADYLQQFERVNNFEKLPPSGGSALFLDNNGKLLHQDPEKSKSSQYSKSLDFRWNTAGVICYASHKYTKESGGGQDHQFRDQKRFLENFKHHNNPQAACFAICDGGYYKPDKMEELESETRKEPPLSFAVHIEDVAEKLEIVAKFELERRQ